MAKEGKLVFGSLDGSPGLEDAGFRVHFDEVEFFSAVSLAPKIPIVKGFMARRVVPGKNQNVCPIGVFQTIEAFIPRNDLALIIFKFKDAAWENSLVHVLIVFAFEVWKEQ